MRPLHACLACSLFVACAAPSRDVSGSAGVRPPPAASATPSVTDVGRDAGPLVDAAAQTVASAERVDREPDDAEWDGLVMLARKAEALRQLPFQAMPEVRIQDADSIRAFMAQELDDADLERETKRYRVLGLLDDSVNLREQAEKQAKEQVLGYYAPTRKRLVLREDVALSLRYALNLRENLEWKSVIVHELVHALQDQHFDLQNSHARAGSRDAGEAYSALVEGDATLTMLQYVIRRTGVTFESVMADPQLLETLVLSRLRHGASFAGPPLLHDHVPFRYVAGAAFVAALWREAGWERVNRAFLAPPLSSADVLNPERYLSRSARARLPRPPRELLGQAGYQLLEEETLGAIVLTAFLATGGVNADSAVEAWSSDRFVLLQREQSVGYAWLIACIDPPSAADLRSVLRYVEEAQHKQRRIRVRSGQEGSYLLVTGNLPEGLHASLLSQLRRTALRH